MKVSIITLHRVYNYGSVLQTYATQEIFKKEGFEVEVIDYVTEQRTKKKILFDDNFRNRKVFKKYFYLIAKLGSVLLKEFTFGRFIKQNIKLTKKYITEDDLELDPPVADIYVTGSDQTWNSFYNDGIDRGFFLDFVPEDKIRISFASSFGKEKLDKNEVSDTKKYISSYKAISVREKSAVNILKELGRLDAVQLLDPTLILTKNIWLDLASKRLVKEPYVLLMLLYNEDNHGTEYARMIADLKGLKLVKISWEFFRQKDIDVLMSHRSPSDFLSLFYYADYIVTNSFHGLSFSINFEKNFFIIPRNNFNTRIDSLLELTNLEGRLIHDKHDIEYAINRNIDYQHVNDILQKERHKAIEFIHDNCK